MNNQYKQLELFKNELLAVSTPPLILPSYDKQRGRWEYLRSKNFGLEYCRNAYFCGKYGIPKLPAYRDEIPKRFISLNDIKRYHLQDCCVTGLEYDWILEKLWYQFDYFIPYFLESYCVTNPDYSLYADSPIAVQIANTYRSHAIGFATYEAGAKLLPLVQWSSTASFEFAFNGYSRGGIVLVSTIGTNQNERSQMYFIEGFNRMLNEIDPEMVLFYGDMSKQFLEQIPKQLPYIIVPHYRFERARRHGR